MPALRETAAEGDDALLVLAPYYTIEAKTLHELRDTRASVCGMQNPPLLSSGTRAAITHFVHPRPEGGSWRLAMGASNWFTDRFAPSPV